MNQPVAPTYRWRRRKMPYMRVTWVGMVAVLLILIHDQLTRMYPMGRGLQVLLFILIVVLPIFALSLWRAGLLPPERVAIDSATSEEEPRA